MLVRLGVIRIRMASLAMEIIVLTFLMQTSKTLTMTIWVTSVMMILMVMVYQTQMIIVH